jgi:hypothetical protein
MTDEQKEQRETSRSKLRRPAIGGINQYATIGGARRNVSESEGHDVQDTRRLDVQDRDKLNAQATDELNVHTPNTLDVQTIEGLNVQTSEVLDAKTAESLNHSTSNSLNVQTPKAKKEERIRQTVYLEPSLDRWVRDYANQERGRLKRRIEISEIVNQALRRMKEELDA